MTAPKRRTPRQWWHSLDAEQKARVYLRVIAVCIGIAVGALLFVLGLLIGGMTPTLTAVTNTDDSVSALRCPADAMRCEASWTRDKYGRGTACTGSKRSFPLLSLSFSRGRSP